MKRVNNIDATATKKNIPMKKLMTKTGSSDEKTNSEENISE